MCKQPLKIMNSRHDIPCWLLEELLKFLSCMSKGLYCNNNSKLIFQYRTKTQHTNGPIRIQYIHEYVVPLFNSVWLYVFRRYYNSAYSHLVVKFILNVIVSLVFPPLWVNNYYTASSMMWSLLLRSQTIARMKLVVYFEKFPMISYCGYSIQN